MMADGIATTSAIDHAASWVLEPLADLRRTVGLLGAHEDDLGRALAATAIRIHRAGGPEHGAALIGAHRLISELQPELSQSVREQVIEVAFAPPPSRAERITWLGMRELCKPLPAMEWAVPGLQLGPGRPYLIVAYAFSLKTLGAQQLALAKATGRAVWGNFSCVAGKVAHFDHEQGMRATIGRYQRSMVGMRTDADAIGDRLRVAVFPDVHLTDLDAADVLARACDGTSLAIIDSFRASTPGAEENSSDVRRYLDLLSLVSDKTGCAFMVLHHAGKSGKDNGYTDSRMVARGSSGIVDACGGVLVLHPPRDKGGPRLVQMAKAPAEATGAPIDDFMLAVEDVEADGDPRAGVCVSYEPIAGEDPQAARSAALAADCERVLAGVLETPDSSPNVLRAKVGIAKTRLLEALEILEQDGRIVGLKRPGRGGGKEYRAT